MTPGQANFKLAYEISPIYLTGGVAGNVPGGTVPLINYTQGGIFSSLIAPGSELNLDNFFAYFRPLPGSKLLSNAVGEYPFANQSVAANAIITMPLLISLMMICPRRQAGDYALFQATITSLKSTLESHILAGGTFTVATPAFLYTNCLMIGFTDASGGETAQAQYQYQLDFRRPLISSDEAAQAYNNLMAKTASQTAFNPDATSDPNSVQATTVGNSGSGASPPVVPNSAPNPSNGFAPSPPTEPGENLSGFGRIPDTTSAVPSALSAPVGLTNPDTATLAVTVSPF